MSEHQVETPCGQRIVVSTSCGLRLQIKEGTSRAHQAKLALKVEAKRRIKSSCKHTDATKQNGRQESTLKTLRYRNLPYCHSTFSDLKLN